MKRFGLLAMMAGCVTIEPERMLESATVYHSTEAHGWQINACQLFAGARELPVRHTCGTPVAVIGWAHLRKPDGWCDIYRDVSSTGLPYVAACFHRQEIMKSERDCFPRDPDPGCAPKGTGTYIEGLVTAFRLSELPPAQAPGEQAHGDQVEKNLRRDQQPAEAGF